MINNHYHTKHAKNCYHIFLWLSERISTTSADVLLLPLLRPGGENTGDCGTNLNPVGSSSSEFFLRGEPGGTTRRSEGAPLRWGIRLCCELFAAEELCPIFGGLGLPSKSEYDLRGEGGVDWFCKVDVPAPLEVPLVDFVPTKEK